MKDLKELDLVPIGDEGSKLTKSKMVLLHSKTEGSGVHAGHVHSNGFKRWGVTKSGNVIRDLAGWDEYVKPEYPGTK